jgi:hypothetical protein
LSNRVKHFRNWICFCSLMKQLRGTWAVSKTSSRFHHYHVVITLSL